MSPSLVFRELLQNSDDASAKAVEIHFETESFAQRQNRTDSSQSDSVHTHSEKLPDLKTAVVRFPCRQVSSSAQSYLRFINGRSKTTALFSGTKTDPV